MNNEPIKTFLPDFCNVYTLFLVILLTELLAFVFVLTPLGNHSYDWNYVKTEFFTDLAMVSWFMQWVTLVSVGILCAIRHRLSQLGSDLIVGLFSYLVILIVTLFISEAAWRLSEYSFSTEFGYNEITSVWQTSPVWHENMTQHLLFLLRNLGISAILSAIALRYFYMQAQWKREMQAHAEAQTLALQARIHPHFLFNSMNTIASLIRLDPRAAEQTVEDFADLFRAALSETKRLITLGDEVALCHQYLRIETLRFQQRLQVHWDVDKIPTDALLPPLCLQPLLENAIYHGIQSLPLGGNIDIQGHYDGKWIQLKITNPIATDLPVTHQGHQIAQQNIRKRLQAYYGTQASLHVHIQPHLYQVTLRFPYKNQYDENCYR